MLVIKNAELIARWAESLGYRVIASFASEGGIHLTLSHPKAGTCEVVIGKNGEYIWREGWPSEGVSIWSAIGMLAEEAHTKAPDLVVQAQRRQERPRRCCADRVEILHELEPPQRRETAPEDVWSDMSLPTLKPCFSNGDHNPEED